MSLDFCCDTKMAGSEFGVKNGSILPCLNGSGWWGWCNGVGDIFLAHFGPLNTNWASFKRHSLPEYCYWPCPSLYDYGVPIFWWLLPAGQCTMSQSSNHLRLVSWTWKWVHFTQMASTVTRTQSNRAHLGCGGTGDVQQLRPNMDQNLWGMFPTHCWIYATKN